VFFHLSCSVIGCADQSLTATAVIRFCLNTAIRRRLLSVGCYLPQIPIYIGSSHGNFRHSMALKRCFDERVVARSMGASNFATPCFLGPDIHGFVLVLPRSIHRSDDSANCF